MVHRRLWQKRTVLPRLRDFQPFQPNCYQLCAHSSPLLDELPEIYKQIALSLLYTPSLACSRQVKRKHFQCFTASGSRLYELCCELSDMQTSSANTAMLRKKHRDKLDLHAAREPMDHNGSSLGVSHAGGCQWCLMGQEVVAGR